MDTCILSRIIDLRFKEETGIAIDKICDLQNIEITTSPKTLEEFLKTKRNKRKTAFKLLFKIISKLEKKPTTIYRPNLWGEGLWGEGVWGGGTTSTDPIYIKISKIFDIDDAEHIYQAYKNNCEYFLTLDKKTILNRAKEYKKELDLIPLNMKFADPVELTKDYFE